MANDKYNRNLDAQANYHESENRRRHIEHENEFLHSEAGGHYIRYNDARQDEIAKKHQEIMGNLGNAYFSKYNGIIIFVVSVILALITSFSNIIGGIIVWNILIFILLYGLFTVTAKTQVRPEISREQAIAQSAREKAYR